MNTYSADIHIHTILSPCADLFMSPNNIIKQACKKKLDIIGITDHNSTRQAPLIKEIGKKAGVFVLCGAEVTTKEETHCLAFMPNIETLNEFQKYLDNNLPDIKNDTDKFGFQVCVDKHENIVFEEDKLLHSAINQSVEQVEKTVHKLGGIFIPAHINKTMFSIISQLGFVPPDLNYDALELSKHISIPQFVDKNKYLKNAVFIQNSDAHILEDIGNISTRFVIKERSFDEIKMALHQQKGRYIITP